MVAISYVVVGLLAQVPAPALDAVANAKVAGWGTHELPGIAWTAEAAFFVGAMALGMGNGSVFQLEPPPAQLGLRPGRLPGWQLWPVRVRGCRCRWRRRRPGWPAGRGNGRAVVSARLLQPAVTLGAERARVSSLQAANRWLHGLARQNAHLRDTQFQRLTTDHAHDLPDLRHVLYRAVALEDNVREAAVAAQVRGAHVAEVIELPPERQTRRYSVMPFYVGETLEQGAVNGTKATDRDD